MTESLWNEYDLSRKSSEVPVKRSPKGVVGEGTCTVRTVGFDCDGMEYIRVGETRIFRLNIITVVIAIITQPTKLL